MKIYDYFFLVLRQFSARKLRTILTMLAIGIGVSAMFLLLSFVYGLQDLVTHRIAPIDSLATADVLPGKLSYLDNNTIKRISDIPEVEETIPIDNLTAQSTLNGSQLFADLNLNATKPNFIKYDALTIAQGRNFVEGQAEIVITTAVNKLFFGTNIDLGQKMTFRRIAMANSEIQNQTIGDIPDEFTIVGIIADDETPTIYMNIDYIKNRMTTEYYSGIKIRVDDVENMQGVKEKISDMGYESSAVYDMIEETSKLFNYLRAIFALFGVIGLVVATIGMFNTMTISLLERTKDIGFMKAFGTTKKMVQKLFLTEAALIGFGGGISGVLIGLILAHGINLLINYIAIKYGGQGFDIFLILPWMIISSVVFSTFLGTFTGIYPSKRAANIPALEAIRYE